MNYGDHYRAMPAVWDTVSEEFLSDSIDTMPLRCYEVIDANRGPTRY